MVFITPSNACYYNCDRMLNKGVVMNGRFKKLSNIHDKMKSQLHGDFEYLKQPEITKVIAKKKEEVKEQKEVTELVKNIEIAKQVNKPVVPAVAPAVVPPVAGAGMEEEKEERKQEMVRDIAKDVIKNKTKGILAKLMNKEKGKNMKFGKNNTPIKIKMGSGISEI